MVLPSGWYYKGISTNEGLVQSADWCQPGNSTEQRLVLLPTLISVIIVI